MPGLTIDLGQLPQGASPQRFRVDPGELGLAQDEWVGAVVANLTVERSGDRISVRGEIEGSAWMECVRCLRAHELHVRTPFEVYADRSGTGRRGEEAELERDDYMRFHDGRRLDLSEDARETLLLELPIAPLCRADCRGLCPRCGADLNEGPCTCTASDPA